MSSFFTSTDVTVSFGGLRALDGLCLDVAEGTILGLIGPNGSGKTTFFNTVSGLCKSSAGTITLDGENITGLQPRDIYRRGITRTFQRSRLCLSLSVFDNVVVGRQRRLDLGLIANLLRRQHFGRELRANYNRAYELITTFSAALADRMFEPVQGLSMIDRRRVEVCRALIADPRLVLLDEPSAGMTPDETHEFMDDVLKIRRSHPTMSIIIIEHEMNVIQRVADKCVVLNYGKKVAEGAFDSVVADPWVREAYLGIS